MEIIAAIVALAKVLMFFLNLWSEKDAAKAQKKADIANDIVKAFQQTDKRERASRLNAALARANRL